MVRQAVRVIRLRPGLRVRNRISKTIGELVARTDEPRRVDCGSFCVRVRYEDSSGRIRVTLWNIKNLELADESDPMESVVAFTRSAFRQKVKRALERAKHEDDL